MSKDDPNREWREATFAMVDAAIGAIDRYEAAESDKAVDLRIQKALRLKDIERELCGVQTLKDRRRLAQEYIEAYDEATKI